MPYYLIKSRFGIHSVGSTGDGYSIKLKWYTAFPSSKSNSIAYNVYWDTDQDYVLKSNPKYISTDSKTEYTFTDFEPGQLYFFNIRPVEYNSIVSNLNSLIDIDTGLKTYPSSYLRESISENDMIIPIEDSSNFPSAGYVKIGYELVEYSSINNNDLIVSLRGANGTYPSYHDVDGYDGYSYLNNQVILYIDKEFSQFDKVVMCQSRFEYPNYPYRDGYGYKQVEKDLLNSDLSESDKQNENFPYFSYTGWRRRDPSKLLAGDCVGSYIGGYQFCSDGYNVGMQIRPISFQDANNQRQELLLEQTGEPVVLLKRMYTGVRCACFQPSAEYPEERCLKCFSVGIVNGYYQHFDSRRSDGRILIRFSPADEDIKVYDAGFESELMTDAWTLVIPTINDRDIIVRYDIADNEEYRYEVLSVNRQRTVLRQSGGQKFRLQRIRKTDIAYQIPVFKNTEFSPSKLDTSIVVSPGLMPHKHSITINESNLSNFNQMTSVEQGHNHQVKYNSSTGKLEVVPALNHTHMIII